MISVRQLVIVASAAVAMLMLGGGSLPCGVLAQGSCSDQCRSAFNGCYKSTSNRAACESQLQRCLTGCLTSKGG